MANPVTLEKDTHRGLRVDAQASEAYGDNIGMVGVVPIEFPRLVAHYPIFLRRTPADDAFECGAMLGFAANENLFLTDNGWDALYVPLNIQRQPFVAAAQAGGGPNSLAVAFDSDSPRVVTKGGEALFQGDGGPSEYLQRVSQALNEMVQGARLGFAYTAKLNEMGLIEKVRVDIQFANGSQVKLDGLYSISRDRLMALPADKLAELRDAGYLECVYFQLASLVHLNALIARKNVKLAPPQPAASAQKRRKS